MITRLGVRGVRRYFVEHNDRASFAFHNMLLRDDQLALRVRVLNSLFAEPAPGGQGRYNHHDGYRP